MRVQVTPFHYGGMSCAWITQDIIEGYIYAWIRGEKVAEQFVWKYAQGDPNKVRCLKEALLDDIDFLELREQIWQEMELPAPGSIEFHIWKIERILENPDTPISEIAKLYKILGEYRGWITKPGEGPKSVLNVGIMSSTGEVISDFRNMSDKDAELTYASLLSGRNR